MKKQKSKYNQQSAIRGALRRTFARSPLIREMMSKVRREVPRYKKDGSRAKKDAVQYLCGVCNVYTGSTKVSVDHVVPVIPETGFTDWNTFIDRLFCDASNLQVVCDDCHQKKTNAERAERQRLRDMEKYQQLKRKFVGDRSVEPFTKENMKDLKRLIKKLQIKEWSGKITLRR